MKTTQTISVILAYDACTFNPFKRIKKNASPRMKSRKLRYIRQQPAINAFLAKLTNGAAFDVVQQVVVATQTWGRADDGTVLEKLELMASERPAARLIFITRDYGFCRSAEWRPEHSRVYICMLPRKFHNKTVDQYTRLEMMYIIVIDITHFVTDGSAVYSRLYEPRWAA